MSDVGMPGKSKRLLHLDLLRLLAIYLVIFNHTADRGFTLFADYMDSPISFLYMFVSVFCKIAVPIFFMISGALLLPKEESLKQLFAKRIARMAVVLLLISVPYYFWLHRANGVSAGSFLSYIYGNSASTSLWYLYSYIGLLLVMPFLRSMVKNMQEKDFLYLMIGHIVLVGVLPCLELLLWKGNVAVHASFTPVLFISQNIFFALAGYYVEHILPEKRYQRRNLIWCVLLSMLALAATCCITYYQTGIYGVDNVEQLEKYFNCFIAVPAIAVYFLLKYAFMKRDPQRGDRWISVLGGAVFGVYLIEKIVRALTSIVYKITAPVVGSFIASMVWCLAVLVVSLIIIVPLKHIPVIKKIVNKFI